MTKEEDDREGRMEMRRKIEIRAVRMAVRLSVRMAVRMAALLILVFAMTLSSRPAAAQQEAIPTIPDAELVFDQALEVYAQGDFERAARRFRLVVFDYPLHQLTTAALLMQGKALYQNEEYERALLALETLIEEYSTSSYVDEARTIADYAEAQLERAAGQRAVLDLGILLPLGSSSVSLTQDLFNGIHLAVQEFNDSGERPVRMVFQATDELESPEAAVRALVDENVDVILGPLFSEEARAAADAAEEGGVVLMAPMATDASVSAGKVYTFQANPSISMRGSKMAEFAQAGLSLDTVGVVFDESNSLAVNLATSFIQSAQNAGLHVGFTTRMSTSSDWYEFGSYVRPGQIDSVDALYMPIVGENANRSIGAALNSLDRMGVEGVRVLGNSEWHNLPIPLQASQFSATYTNEFYPDTSSAAVNAFADRYGELAGRAPNRLGYTGYDLTRYLLAMMNEAGERPLYEILHAAPPYSGLALRFNFQNGNINEGLYYFRYRFGELELLR